MKIGITFNVKDEVSPQAILDAEYCEEFDAWATIDAICNVFEKNGHSPVRLGWGKDFIEKIRTEKVDFVFNIAEGHFGRNREAHMPSLLEMLNIPYSGSDPLTLALTLDKIMAKKLAIISGIPVPGYKVVSKYEDVLAIKDKLKYPVITKPAWEGSSKGIYNFSKANDKNELTASVSILLKKYPNQPIIVEEYIEGREITVGVIGNKNPRIIGVMEIVNKHSPGKDFFYSIEVKRDWKNLVDYIIPPDRDTILNKHIRYYALLAFKEFGLKDIARMDFRISRNGDPFLLEINPLPGLSPEYADLVIMSKLYGIEYEKLVLGILNQAMSRYNEFKVEEKYIS